MPKKTIRELNEIRKLQIAISNRLDSLREVNEDEDFAQEFYELEKSSWELITRIEQSRRSVNYGLARANELLEMRREMPDTKLPKREVMIIGGVRV